MDSICTIKYIYKIFGTTFNAVADTTAGNTALTIGSNVSAGNIVIGGGLGAGDISIATAQTTGGTVAIGSANTVMTLSGDVLVTGGGTSGTTGVLAGRTGYDTVSGNFTIPATINSTYFLRITGGTPNITLPVPVIGQTIIFRSITTGLVTINASASTTIILNGSFVSILIIFLNKYPKIGTTEMQNRASRAII